MSQIVPLGAGLTDSSRRVPNLRRSRRRGGPRHRPGRLRASWGVLRAWRRRPGGCRENLGGARIQRRFRPTAGRFPITRVVCPGFSGVGLLDWHAAVPRGGRHGKKGLPAGVPPTGS
jgi:hypothetical protein